MHYETHFDTPTVTNDHEQDCATDYIFVSDWSTL